MDTVEPEVAGQESPRGSRMLPRLIGNGFSFLVVLFTLGSFFWLGWDMVAVFQGRDLLAETERWLREWQARDGEAQEGPGQAPGDEPRVPSPIPAPGRPALAMPSVADSPVLARWGRFGFDWSRLEPGAAAGSVAGLDVAEPGVVGPAAPAGEGPVVPAAGEPVVPALAGPRRPRLAIVIDDWGYPWSAAPSMLELPGPLTVAVIPGLPYSREQAEAALARGHEVILHLPMEPLNGREALEPGTILVDMSPVEILAALHRGLESVPGAVGVNNHMGSRATADPRVMHSLMADLRRRGLFFLDSYTTPKSVAPQAAAAHGVPFAVNHIFLDNDPREEAVVGQLRKAMALAQQQGEAVAIGHVRPGTYAALARMLPEMEAAGIQLVPVSRLIRRLPPPKGFGSRLHLARLEEGVMVHEPLRALRWQAAAP